VHNSLLRFSRTFAAKSLSYNKKGAAVIFHSKEILESDMLGTHKMAKDPIEKKRYKKEMEGRRINLP